MKAILAAGDPEGAATQTALADSLSSVVVIRKELWNFDAALERESHLLATYRFANEKGWQYDKVMNREVDRRYPKITSLTARLQEKTNEVIRLRATQEEFSNAITSLTADLQDERKAKKEVSAKLDEAHAKMKVERYGRRGQTPLIIFVCILMIIFEGAAIFSLVVVVYLIYFHIHCFVCLLFQIPDSYSLFTQRHTYAQKTHK